MIPIKKARKIIEMVADGTPLESACAMVRVNPQLALEVIEKGFHMEEMDKDEKWFFKEYLQAMAEYERSLFQKLENAGPAEWQKIAWIIERRFPEIWAKKDKESKSSDIKVEVVRNVPRPEE